VGGRLGAGLTSNLAGQLESLSKGVAAESGSELLGNLAANVAAGVGGALVGGTAGAATGSNVELYNQMNHQKKDLVSQVCGAGAQCSEATLNAAIRAQTDLSTQALGTISPNYVSGGISVLSGTGGAAINLYDGTTYVSGGVTQNFPISAWNPGLTGTIGWIFGAHDAQATNAFLNGDGNQAFISIPTPFKVNLVGAVTHAYGGATAIEVGIGSPGDVGFGVTPWSHSTPVIGTGK
jgi:filamentous hemagglutinin